MRDNEGSIYVCPKCGGSGEGKGLLSKKCKLCNGRGRVDLEEIQDYTKRPHREIRRVENYNRSAINDKVIE